MQCQVTQNAIGCYILKVTKKGAGKYIKLFQIAGPGDY